MSEIPFTNLGHKERFTNRMQHKIYQGKYDPEYGAALYILTSHVWIWESASSWVERDRIDFDGMLGGMDLTAGSSTLIKLAYSLFHGNLSIVNAADIAARLDGENFEIALAAFRMRRYGLRIKDVYPISS